MVELYRPYKDLAVSSRNSSQNLIFLLRATVWYFFMGGSDYEICYFLLHQVKSAIFKSIQLNHRILENEGMFTVQALHILRGNWSKT